MADSRALVPASPGGAAKHAAWASPSDHARSWERNPLLGSTHGRARRSAAEVVATGHRSSASSALAPQCSSTGSHTLRLAPSVPGAPPALTQRNSHLANIAATQTEALRDTPAVQCTSTRAGLVGAARTSRATAAPGPAGAASSADGPAATSAGSSAPSTNSTACESQGSRGWLGSSSQGKLRQRRPPTDSARLQLSPLAATMCVMLSRASSAGLRAALRGPIQSPSAGAQLSSQTAA